VAVLRIHPVQQQYVDSIHLNCFECFVDVAGKDTARIGRSDKLMTEAMSLKVTFCGLSQISDVNMPQRNNGCSVNGTHTLVDLKWLI